MVMRSFSSPRIMVRTMNSTGIARPRVSTTSVSYVSSSPRDITLWTRANCSGAMNSNTCRPSKASRGAPTSAAMGSLRSVIRPSWWNTMPSALACMNLAMRSSLWRTAASASRWRVMSLISTKAPIASPSPPRCGTRLTSSQRGRLCGPTICRTYDAVRRACSMLSICGWISRAAASPITSTSGLPMTCSGERPNVVMYKRLA